MRIKTKKLILISALFSVMAGNAPGYSSDEIFLPDFATIQDLDDAALFTFAIMSDNKGDSSFSSPEFAKMVGWISEADCAFVIGLGDHVKRGWENSFITFLEENQWWHDHFYPNVADGENEFYGSGQDDWGAGAPMLEEVDLASRPGVEIRENGCEYYAQIQVDDYTVHLIQLHYPDSPRDNSIAFNQDSRQYLIDTLSSVEKGPQEIIIIGAHSIDGFWLDELSPERQELVLDKADLVLSATTHFFERSALPDYRDSGPLCINTGSITFPALYCPPGFVQVHVLEEPFSLVVQYIDASQPQRDPQQDEYTFIKIVDGPILGTNFCEPQPEEDMEWLESQK